MHWSVTMRSILFALAYLSCATHTLSFRKASASVQEQTGHNTQLTKNPVSTPSSLAEVGHEQPKGRVPRRTQTLALVLLALGKKAVATSEVPNMHERDSDPSAQTTKADGAPWASKFSFPAAPIASFAVGAAVIPHPEKAYRTYTMPPHVGGEDAYFVEEDAGVVGVADGVGGWARQGVDPGIFSRQLMNLAAKEVRAGTVDPFAILKRAHAKTTAMGSSTALILSLTPWGSAGKKLTAANVGDSGFVHVRDGEVLYKSHSRQHAFNFPFQLFARGAASFDKPDRVQHIERTDVRIGDVVVLGSDGLFDNLFIPQIGSIVQRGRKTGQSPTALAQIIATEASRAAHKQHGNSPFSLEASKEGHRYPGGKLDDITVVVAVVGEKGLEVK